MPCPDEDFHVTPWRPSFHRMETNESLLVGRGKKSARGSAALGANSLSSGFFVNKK
jgi:hypothetical protein